MTNMEASIFYRPICCLKKKLTTDHAVVFLHRSAADFFFSVIRYSLARFPLDRMMELAFSSGSCDHMF